MATGSGYAGASARARSETSGYACPCGERFGVTLARVVEVGADEAAARAFVDGGANRARCPACGEEREVQVSVVFHDAARALLVLVLPDGLRHRELEERGRLYLELARDGQPAPRYVREFEVVFGVAALAALIAARDAASDDDAAEAEAPPEPARPVTGPTWVKHPLPDARRSAVERWVANREAPATLLCGDDVVVCMALPRGEMHPFIEGRLELRVQLHRMPSYPVLALTLVTRAGVERRPRALHALVEIGRAAHRAVLDRLMHDCRLHLELYDPSYTRVVERVVEAPLEENVRHLFAAAKEALQRTPAAERNFDRARTALLAAAYDRLGRAPVALPLPDALDSPRRVQRAVAELARWAEPEAERHLVEVRSLPLAEWRALRAAVVRRALEFGIHAPRPIVERVLAESQVTAGWSDALRRQLGAFLDVAAGKRPNDLEPAEMEDNWRLLVGECLAAGVAVDDAVARMDEARRLLAGGAERTDLGGVDVARLATPELVAALERKDVRREAALALCARRDADAVRPLFDALPKMTRAEANRVLPAMVNAFGAALEPLLVDGLKGRKSYLRQGCALGLGSLASLRSAPALAALVVAEPTEVWREAARAVGDLGGGAAAALAARIPGAREEQRARIARALAHVAARGGRAAVDKLAAGGEAEAREIARAALALVEEVLLGDVEVRAADPPRPDAHRDETVIRGFTRRFYEALGGDHELVDSDLQELHEPDDEDGIEQLDDADFVEVATAAADGTDPRMSLRRDGDA